MSDDPELRFMGIAWAFLFGMTIFPVMLAFVWSRREPWARRLRLPVSVVTILYLIAMVVLFANAKR